MPDTTPNFGIPYPCAGETIDPTVFQDFADGVEAALASVDALSSEALHRPSGAIRLTVPQAAAVNVFTTLNTYNVTDFATGGMVAGAGGFVTPTAGVYMVDLEVNPTGVTTSITAYVSRIFLAGNKVYARKFSPLPAPATSVGQMNVSGLISASAGQAVAFQFGWNGAGVPLNVYSRATICRLSL